MTFVLSTMTINTHAKRLGWLVLVMAACGGDEGAETKATLSFAGTNGQTVAGTGDVSVSGTKVTLRMDLTAAPPGTHGVHVHMNPSCGNNGMDAGAHWDTTGTGSAGHGLPPGGHIGDLGNITIGADGKGSLEFSNAAWTLGDGAPTDILPHAIIFHELADDGSMPSAGARWGCAVITAL
jgi:Cu-Zn family superoxide dismutase